MRTPPTVSLMNWGLEFVDGFDPSELVFTGTVYGL